jgi:DNA modification methylase
MSWHNRIVGHDEVPPDQLMAHPDNWRIHPKYQQEALRGVINDIGYIKSVTVNKTTGRVVDGHLRVTLALRDGIPTIPVEYVELTEAEEAEALLTLDPIAALAGSDKDNLELLLAKVGTENDAVMKLLEDTAARAGLEWGQAEQADAEPQIDRAAELQQKWQTETGQLWQLGEHRLLIGSSIERENVSRVFGDVRARLVWTDPPYGVKYGEKLDSSNPMGYRVRTIENDDLPPAELEVFIRTALTHAAEFSKKGAAIYVASPAGTLLPSLIKAFDGSGFDYRWGLIWLKDQIVLSRADYHFKHENILYGWKSDGPHFFVDDRTQRSVFEYPRPKKSDEHPTMKPVDLVRHMIRNSSEKGDIVYDCFGGSGSTLLACQNEGRVCRIIELSPNYGAVILERFATAFPAIEIKKVA